MMPKERSTINDAPVLDPFKPPLPQERNLSFQWGSLKGSGQGLVIAEAVKRHKAPILLITANMMEAEIREREIRFYLSMESDQDKASDVLIFPDRETLPYDVFSPHQDIVSERLATLYRLPEFRQGVVIVPVDTLMVKLPPRSFLEEHCLLIDIGDTLEQDTFRKRLDESGYRLVSQVMEHGEYAIRGGIIDLFPMGAHLPFRIDLFDDEVESIRTFLPDDQRSVDKVDSIHLLPAREYPISEAATDRFRKAWRAHFPGDASQCPVYTNVSDGQPPGGIEYYLPLFFEQTSTLFDHLPKHTVILGSAAMDQAASRTWSEINDRYMNRANDKYRPLLPPEQLYLTPEEIAGLVHPYPHGILDGFRLPEAPHHANFPLQSLPALHTAHETDKDPVSGLAEFIRTFSGRVLLVADSNGRRESLKDRLKPQGIFPADIDDWQAFLIGDQPLGLTTAHLDEGLVLESVNIAIITDTQLFGASTRQRKQKKRLQQRDADAIISDLNELAVGSPVVHEEHGVGRYLGLTTLDGGDATEFLLIEYADEDKLYVPVSSLQLVGRYTGASPEQAPLHRLGSGQWAKARRKAAQKASDVAAELLDIYARRQARQGYNYPEPADDYAAFVAAFPFEETPDQQEAIEAVISDMTASRPMDRLVCGDVGFGKTEVAMRAAFLAVQGGKQVAVLVPTTLLAQQHHQNFLDRFAQLPFRIEVLSRFRSGKQQATTLDAIATGKVDIVIGTHKLIQPAIRFKRLGLVIIDEEHRFGVRQKEKFKALRSEVDVLTLTATPIPRTLNMAVSGIRDLSIIATPPLRRLAIKTFVREWDMALLREACMREIHRGGQIYFLHNEVSDIERIAAKLRELVPEASVVVGHGQMPEKELERVMLEFYHQRHHILLSTTIIESGIDIPNANTIIINRADRLGLAQLYQIRGRVGRSHHQAYAYLIAPPRGQMTADAVKRLEAIESIEDLGAGFTLATHDLEIRGAGELLGDEQSGQIHEVGFSMYSQLLERAVAAIKSGKEPNLEAPLNEAIEIRFTMPALIPDDYIGDVHLRLVMYKRIAGADSQPALEALKIEMIDRFGLLPDPAKMLFHCASLRMEAQALGITKIDARGETCRLTFTTPTRVDPFALLRLVQSQPQRYRLAGSDRLGVTFKKESEEDRSAEVNEILAEIAASNALVQEATSPA